MPKVLPSRGTSGPVWTCGSKMGKMLRVMHLSPQLIWVLASQNTLVVLPSMVPSIPMMVLQVYGLRCRCVSKTMVQLILLFVPNHFMDSFISLIEWFR